MNVDAISTQNNPGPNTEALPIEHVSEENQPLFGKIFLIAGCAYHAFSAPFLSIPSFALGALSSSPSFPLKMKTWQTINPNLGPAFEDCLCINMALGLFVKLFTPVSTFGWVHPFLSAFPSFLTGRHLYQTCESYTFQRPVDTIADKLSSGLDLAM